MADELYRGLSFFTDSSWDSTVLAAASVDHARDLAAQLVGHLQRPEAGDRAGVIKIPRILREPDEIADVGIGRPRAAKGRTGELGRHARREEGADVGLGGDRLERR